jgi:hypothetical protein
MAKINAHVFSFNVGEMTRAGMARVDQERVKLAAEVQENLHPYTIGKAQVRPGTQYLGSTASNAQARLIPFIRSVDEKAVLEFTNHALRVWVDDELVTRTGVTATISNGDFSSSSGWSISTTGGATANINSTVTGALYLAAPSRGGLAVCKQEVTTTSIGTEHGLAINVTRGPVVFRCGATEGGDEYIGEITLDTGVYSLGFIHSGINSAADSFTKLMLHFDGSDASTTFTDSSLSARAVTANNDAQLDTAQSKFGGSSLLLDGTGDYASCASSTDFNMDSGDWTIDCWVRPNALAADSSTILHFPNTAGGLHGLHIHITDAGAIRVDNGTTTSGLLGGAVGLGVWSHIAVTNESGTIKVWLNGTLVDSEAAQSYGNTASLCQIGRYGAGGTTNDWNGWVDELRISKGIARWTSNFTPPAVAYGAGGTFWVQFSTTQERPAIVNAISVESAGVMSLTAPWATSELREIRYDQSIDVMFLAHENWQQHKIERIGDERSWGVALYQSDDGPFTTGRTALVRLKPGATRGSTTLTAENPFFNSDHVGALFRLTHEGFSGSFSLAAERTFTDSVRVFGIGALNDYSVVVSGTFVGTLTLQVSFDGPDTGFISTSTTITAPGTTALTTGTDHDNIEFWVRVGFLAGAYTSGAAVVQIVYTGYVKSGICRVTAFNSTTSVDVDVLDDFGSTDYTDNWQEGEWSEIGGWPTAVAFFDGRLWWARNDRFWASESDGYYAFNLETEGDAGSIQRSIATGGAVNTCHWLLPLQRLVFGTDGSEATARASTFDQPLTPTNLTLKDASTQGAANVSPVKMDGRGIFVQRSGLHVYEVFYSLDKQDYTSNSLTKFNDEIGGDGLLEVAVQRQPQSYVWLVREDGECPVLLYDPQEQVAGWFRFISAPSIAGDAEVESVCVLPETVEDAVYLSVKRTINGATVRFVEKMMPYSTARGAATSKMADAGTLTAGPVSSVTLSHLASETGLVGWGTNSSTGVSGPITGLSADSSGVIALGATYTNVFVGLKYNWRYKSSKLAYAAQGGTALLQRKRVSQVGLLAADVMYGAIQFGPDFDTMDPLPLIKDGTDVSQTTAYSEWDEPSFPFRGGWETDSRLCMKGSAPYPATLLGLVVGIDTREAG